MGRVQRASAQPSEYSTNCRTLPGSIIATMLPSCACKLMGSSIGRGASSRPEPLPVLVMLLAAVAMTSVMCLMAMASSREVGAPSEASFKSSLQAKHACQSRELVSNFQPYMHNQSQPRQRSPNTHAPLHLLARSGRVHSKAAKVAINSSG
jgi:hypothetical protein